MTFKERFPLVSDFASYVESTYDLSPVSWVTGGTAGGNCWGEGGHYSLEADKEPEMNVLDDILLDVFPSLSFMQYRVLMKRDIITLTPYSYHEYYGNSTDGMTKEIEVDELYRALSDF